MLRNTMRNMQLATLFAIAGVASAPPVMAQPSNGTNCWKVPDQCAQVRQRWDEDSDTVTITRVTNYCGSRIVLRLCNETENNGASKWICHNYALADGESIDQTTFFSTDRFRVLYAGSSGSANDTACLSKDRN